MNSCAILLLLAVIGICDAAAFPEANNIELMQQQDSNVIGGEKSTIENVASEVKSESKDTEDLLPSAPQQPNFFGSLVSGIREYLKTPRDDSLPVQIGGRTISGYEAVLLAPALIELHPKLSAALDSIDINENMISAIRLRSLVPDYVIDAAELTAKRKMVYSHYRLPTSRERIIDLLDRNLDSFVVTQNIAALNQIGNFDFNGSVSLDEFVANKEARIAMKTAELLEISCQIQQLLKLDAPTSTETLPPLRLRLNFIKRELGDMSCHYKRFQVCQERIHSGTPSEKARALNKLPEQRNYVSYHLQRIVDVL